MKKIIVTIIATFTIISCKTGSNVTNKMKYDDRFSETYQMKYDDQSSETYKPKYNVSDIKYEELQTIKPVIKQEEKTSIVEAIEYMESSARVLEPEHNMLLTPLIADLKVSANKVYYTEKELFANMNVTHKLLTDITELKKIALSRAAHAHKADVLVGSTIDIVTKNGHLEISVSGYPANYVNFRNAKSNDFELLKQVESIKTINGTNIVNSPKPKLNIINTKESY
ncbi:MAG: hypothetical protein IJY44_06875 [Bacteroidaceae bacterium]|nr:hypothetical protein [Bacteroidaceae bacterium]